jgi:TonB-dependent SusC/RagA subfamily outer membrane receptor
MAPFSFFNYIVYNPTQFNEEELLHILNHEKVHAQHLHSLDTIVAQIICVILWFNPFAWLYKKALQQNLEFIADQKAQHVSPCKKSYQTVLLKASVKNHQLVFTNNFYTSLIKKRIAMLHKSKSKKRNQLKLILVLPLLAFFIMSFNTKTIYLEANTEHDKSIHLPSDSGESIEIIFTKNTSDEDLEEIKKELKSKGITFIYKDVKRNSDGEIIGISTEFRSKENASNYNIYGEKSIAAFQFKSSDDTFGVGTLNYTFVDENTKVQSSNSSNKVVIIEESDDHSKIDVKTFKNKDSIYVIRRNNKFTLSTDDSNDSNIIFRESDEPIFIINGKKVEKSIFEDVDSEDIQSVFVLKGKKAVEKFGDEGKNGAIIMTKKGSKFVFSESEDDQIKKTKGEFIIETDGDTPLYIIDGKVVEKDDLNDINPNQIDSVEVLKDQTAITMYGKEGENGVIIIKTKKNGILNSKNKGILIEKEDGSPYQIEVSNVYVTYNNEEIAAEFIITKSSSDAFLEHQKEALKKHGIDAKFSKVKRNKADEISSIKISLDDNNGRKSSASWKEKSQGIPDIVLGKSNDDKLFVRAIGN